MTDKTKYNDIATWIESAYNNLTSIEKFMQDKSNKLISNESTEDSYIEISGLYEKIHDSQHLFWALDRIANHPRINEKSSWLRLDKKYLSWVFKNRQQYLYESITDRALSYKIYQINSVSEEIDDHMKSGKVLDLIKSNLDYQEEGKDSKQSKEYSTLEGLEFISNLSDKIWASLPPFTYIKIEHRASQKR